MNSAPPTGYCEGQDINRSPLFKGQYYLGWKERMKDFFQAVDYELWNIIIDGPQYPMKKNVENKDVLKEKNEYDEVGFKCLERMQNPSIFLFVDLE